MKNKKNFKKLTLFDLAASRVKNTNVVAEVFPGDLIEIIEPFASRENYLGVVINVNDTHMNVYHSDIRKTILWDRCVKCKISRV